jgi:hypothetical protein
MFSPYSPAFASDAGALSCVVRGELALAAAGLLVFAVGSFWLTAFREVDMQAFSQIIKKTITTNTPSAIVFHQSRGNLFLTVVFIVLLLFFKFRQRRIPQ